MPLGWALANTTGVLIGTGDLDTATGAQRKGHGDVCHCQQARRSTREEISPADILTLDFWPSDLVRK